MIRTKYFDADVLVTPEIFEVQSVFTKTGENVKDLIDELEAWPKVEEIVKAEYAKLAKQNAVDTAVARAS